MGKTKKVVFMLPTLHAGGAERVISYVYKNFNSENFESSLLITGLKSESKFFTDDDSIIFLNKLKVRQSIFLLIKYLIKNKPDVVFSSLSHLNIVLAYLSIFFPKTVFVGRETFLRSDTKDYKIKRGSKFSKLLSKIAYKLLDYIVCQSNDMKSDLHTNIKIPKNKVRVINNPITNFDDNKIKTQSLENIKETKFITVGRLSKIKGHVRIIKLLSKVNYPFKYTIVGTGTDIEKQTIKNVIDDCSMNDKVEFIDFTKNINSYLVENDFFIQGSYIEGFPNALLESCAVGVPVIAFKAPGGTKEIVENNVNGYLVENESEFLLRLNSLGQFDPKQVSDSVMKKFGKDIILKQYEDFFEEIVKNNNGY